MIWNCGSHSFDLKKPIVMGILNVTPDSFSDGGDHNAFEGAIAHAEKLLANGADIIDVGGESTRPGSDEVLPEEELARVLPVIEALAGRGCAISIDTRHPDVARACVEAGACIINDVSGFCDLQMKEVARNCEAGLVVMHMAGKPKDMQDAPDYADVVSEVETYLLDRAGELEALGVAHDRICLDPGVGFGKRRIHNELLLAATRRLAASGFVYMVAVSRKSFIGAVSGIDEPKGRDEASALCAAAAYVDGARIIRAHNVEMTRQVLADSHRALIGLGSNIGDRVGNLDAAIARLCTLEHTWFVTASSYYESEPAYREDQESFANAVAIIQTRLSPDELLDALHRIEDDLGRVRTVENGPRTLDLDILDYSGVVVDTPSLTLPHPGILERDFVVSPILELVADMVLADGTAVTRADTRVGEVIGFLKGYV